MKFVSRAQWGARSPKRRHTASLNSVSTAHWNGPKITVGGRTTWDHSRCASIIRGIQNYHMDAKNWNDGAYNFIECPHGYTFEVRGLNVINGANGTNTGNRTSHAVMSLAGEGNPFPDLEKIGFRECVMYIANSTGAPEGCIGHRDHKATACPGNERYSWVHQGMPTPAGTSDPSPPPSTELPVLRYGSRGDEVRWMQTIIRDKAGGNISVDGIFGRRTESRVKDVQKFFKLTVDGIVGAKTWGVLNFLSSIQVGSFADWPTRKKSVIKMGATGNEVRYLQRVIARKAGGNIGIDGVFGSQTESRVKDVQKFFKIKIDGIVGPQTWGIIDFLATT